MIRRKPNKKFSNINSNVKDLNTDHSSIFQDDSNTYTKEDLIHKGAIIGSKKGYFLSYIKSFKEGNLLFKGRQDMEGLALFIYNQNTFFVHHYSGYKRMKYSSILSLLRTYSKDKQGI